MSDDDGPSTVDFEESARKRLTRRGLLATAVPAAWPRCTGLGAARASAAASRVARRRALAGTVTLGSYETDPGIKALAAVTKKFTQNTGIEVKTNTVDHNTFQNQINSYLQGKPDDVFTWFAGYRMQFFAAKGLATPIDDVWKTLDAADAAGDQGRVDGRSTATSTSCRTTTTRGPSSTARASGRRRATRVPKTWDQFIALAKKMKADGLTPIAFTDKDGWPAMGTFDILNMRINGYQFHVDLMAGKEAWDGPQVEGGLQPVGASSCPYYSPGALGPDLAGGRAQLENKQAGMFLLGGFVGQQLQDRQPGRPRLLPVPVDQPEVGAGLDRRPDRRLHALEEAEEPRRREEAARLPRHRAGDQHLPHDRTRATSRVNKHANKSHYTPLQKKEATLIANAKHIAQYMDRDTRPDFASTVMIPSLQSFLNKPSDVNGLVKSIQKQKKAIFGS